MIKRNVRRQLRRRQRPTVVGVRYYYYYYFLVGSPGSPLQHKTAIHRDILDARNNIVDQIDHRSDRFA